MEEKKMEVSKIKKALIEQKNIRLSGNLYHKTQLDFAYNTNHIEGSTITPDETASIYDTGTILTSSDKVIVLKDATETKNHFILFKYMLDTIEDKLTEDMIKRFHFIFSIVIGWTTHLSVSDKNIRFERKYIERNALDYIS